MDKLDKRGGNVLSIAITFIVLVVFTLTLFSTREEKKEVTTIKNKTVAADAVIDDEIIHTHIWATTHDAYKHWEYCTICARIRNEEQHTFVDNWFNGESCGEWTYSTRICSCGYNYIYHKPHGNLSDWNIVRQRIVHNRRCNDCGIWIDLGRCANANGYLSCVNPGTCSTCGNTTSSNSHYITFDGKCRDCGKKFFDFSEPTVTYESNYSKAYIKITIKPLYDYVELLGNMTHYSYTKNYTDYVWTSVRNADRSYTYTGTFTFDPNAQAKAKICIGDVHGFARINGTDVYAGSDIGLPEIWQDHVEPQVTNIGQVDQTKSGDWATIKELTFTGTDNLSKIVTLSLEDKLTGDIIFKNEKTSVVNGTYVYKATPPIEAPAEGRDYVLTIVDEIGNVKKHTFTIYRTDSRAPILRKSEFTEWSKTKYLEIPMTDYGSGLAQTSLDNQYSYKDTKYENGMYYGLYTFAEENYGVDTHALYLRDGLGNARGELIKVGRVDNTKPTIKNIISSTESNGLKLTIIADDYCEQLKAQGSGVTGYAITRTADSDPTSWSTNNVQRVTGYGIYYVWVRDRVGNISDVRQINVKPDFTIPDLPTPEITLGGDPSNVTMMSDKYPYAYYIFDIKTMRNKYLKSTGFKFGVFGEKNNEEDIKIYLSSSPDKVWPNTDSNKLSWDVSNTREKSRSNSVYTVEGNNICSVTPKNVSSFLGDSDKKSVYIHVIFESGAEEVVETSIVKRSLFEQH